MLTARMFQANPALRAASTAHLAEVAEFGGPALIAEVGRHPDDPMVKIVNAAVSAAITEYFATAFQPGADLDDVQKFFVRYLRVIITGARPT